MRQYMPGAPAQLLPYAPARVHRRRYAAGRTLHRFFRRNVGRYRRFNNRVRTSSLQSMYYYRYRMTPQQRAYTRRRYYRTGTTRLLRMQGRRPRFRKYM